MTEDRNSGNNLPEKENRLLELLQKGPSTITEVSETFNIPKEDVFDFLDEVRDSIYQKTGYIVELEKKARRIFLRKEAVPRQVIKLPKVTSRIVKILITSDWGWGLKTQQEDLVETAFREAEKEEPEVWFSLVAGNFCAGKPSPREREDYFLTTFEEQLEYLVRHFPKSSFKHYLINSWRELSWKKPRTMGEALAERREDIKCYGNHRASFLVGRDTFLILSHIERDPSFYTISHGLQVSMERYQDATEYIYLKENTPDILLLGGINVDVEIPPKLPLKKERENNFYGIALSSLCTATSFQLSRSGRRAVPFALGYLILILEFDEKGYLKGEPIFDVRSLTGYQKKDSYLDDVVSSPELNDEQRRLIISLNEKPMSRGELSKNLKKSIPHALGVIKQLQEKGYKIIEIETEKRFKLMKPLKERFKPVSINIENKTKIAAFGDTHLGHRNERPDLLGKVYQIAEERGVDRIFHCGDVFDGRASYPLQEWELIYHLADEQRDHGLEIWPKSKIWTDFIRGSAGHETAFLKSGYDIVRNFCELAWYRYRRKLRYLGGITGVSEINKIRFQLLHPRGGIPRGISYRPQILVEEIVKDIEKYSREKNLISGHLHVAAAMNYKGIFTLMVPCLQDTTDYLKSGGHISWLGMWICEVFMDKFGNIVRTIREYVPFEPREEIPKRIKGGRK